MGCCSAAGSFCQGVFKEVHCAPTPTFIKSHSLRINLGYFSFLSIHSFDFFLKFDVIFDIVLLTLRNHFGHSYT